MSKPKYDEVFSLLSDAIYYLNNEISGWEISPEDGSYEYGQEVVAFVERAEAILKARAEA